MFCNCIPWTIAALLITALSCRGTTNVINNKIDRLIDLSSQLVVITERIYIEGTPEFYTIKIEPSHRDRLAFIEASVGGQNLNILEKPDGLFEVNLGGQSTKAQPLVVLSVFTKLLQPYPAEISQSERQLVRYRGFQTTLSPYLTKTITTRIKLPQSSRLESFTKASKMTTSSSKITYGPFKDVQPNEAEPLIIHYENNTPFIAIKKLTRTVEISPWARSINIANEVKIQHIGAKLKGPFSRFEYQRDHSNGISSVRNLVVELPKTSTDIYFRDGIGNISTSNVRISNAKTMVGIKPRFPLFGGWGTDFNLGYRVPISEFLNEPKAGNNFRLSLPFADVMYENMFVEEATVKIYLPAGASDIEVKGSVGFKTRYDEKSYSYLDVIGRPVVVLEKSNMVTHHIDNKPLIIRYNYSKLYMLQEPILLLAAAISASVLVAITSKMSKNGPISSSKAKSD